MLTSSLIGFAVSLTKIATLLLDQCPLIFALSYHLVLMLHSLNFHWFFHLAPQRKFNRNFPQITLRLMMVLTELFSPPLPNMPMVPCTPHRRCEICAREREHGQLSGSGNASQFSSPVSSYRARSCRSPSRSRALHRYTHPV